LERLLIAAAAALVGLYAVFNILLPVLSQLGQGLNWTGVAEYALALLIPFALLIPAVIRPQSVVAAVVASLPIGFLLMLGLNAEPMSLSRFDIHLAAILCLVALVMRMIRGIVDHRFRVLWIAPALLVGLVIGYLSAAALGLHIRSEFCNWPLLGAEVSSYLCSG
jgi:hypothetical protein